MEELTLSLISDDGKLSLIRQRMVEAERELVRQQEELNNSLRKLTDKLYSHLEALLCENKTGLASKEDFWFGNDQSTVLSYQIPASDFESFCKVEINYTSKTINLSLDAKPYAIRLEDFADRSPEDQFEEFNGLKDEAAELQRVAYETDLILFRFAQELGFQYQSSVSPLFKNQPYLPGLKPTEIKEPIKLETEDQTEIAIDYLSGKGLDQLEIFISLLGKFKDVEKDLEELSRDQFSAFEAEIKSFRSVKFSATLHNQLTEKPIPYRVTIDHSNGISVEIKTSSVKVDYPESLEDVESLHANQDAIKKNNLALDQLLKDYAQENKLAYSSPFSYQK